MRALLILPPVTVPWDERLERRHSPQAAEAKAAYRAFRPCLRWEFAFSCAFCLLHEADLMLAGVEGWGISGIEHFQPQSSRPDLRNSLDNCFYACDRCNRARGVSENRTDEGSLLNSCDVALGEVFIVVEDEFRPAIASDTDAHYTLDTYRLNDPPKVRMRRLRREAIERRKAFLEGSRALQRRLLDRAEVSPDPDLVNAAQELGSLSRLAASDLSQFPAIPLDRPIPCSCTEQPALPDAMAKQTFDLRELVRPA